MKKSKAPESVAKKAASSGFFSLEAGDDALLIFDNSFRIRPLCGLDEAGRGPLAGPLVAAAVILDHNKPLKGVKDSKKLTASQRESLYPQIVECSLAFGIGVLSNEDVDRLNPLRAAMEAMRLAFLGLKLTPALALVDGNTLPELTVASQAVVKGDSLSQSIAAASIIAKVERDRMMLELHREYPVYGFDRHKGYPTKAHYEALRVHGPSKVHRLSYRGVLPQD
jgi:ribonuclease HII